VASAKTWNTAEAAKRLACRFCSRSVHPASRLPKLARKQMSEQRLERRARDMDLLREACRFVRKYRPELVLSENVPGIDDPKYGGVWEEFRRALERIGYATGSKGLIATL